jgi:hypothetical protein
MILVHVILRNDPSDGQNSGDKVYPPSHILELLLRIHLSSSRSIQTLLQTAYVFSRKT